MQAGSMEDFQTITDAVAAGSELVTFVAYKAKRPEVWAFFFTDGQLTQFRTGRDGTYHFSLVNCDRAIKYDPGAQQFTLIKDRFPSSGKFERLTLVSYCREFLHCNVDMNGIWVNAEDATFFHLKWAGQPNQSY